MSDESPLTFTEWHPRYGRGFAMRVRRILEASQSPYQRIEMYETSDGGRLLTLDGLVMVCSTEEWTYHEMIAHVPLFAHPEPRRVLVIGGGDGGTAREALRHPSVEHVDLVDIDAEVYAVSERHLPETAASFADARLHRHAADGAAFVRDHAGAYDVVLVDSSEPVGPGEVLFERAFYESVARALGPRGVMACQSESPFADGEVIRRIHGNLRGVFDDVALYLTSIPFYPSGLWSFTLGAKALGRDPREPARPVPADWSLRYYNADVHRAAFVLPTFARRLVTGDGESRPG